MLPSTQQRAVEARLTPIFCSVRALLMAPTLAVLPMTAMAAESQALAPAASSATSLQEVVVSDVRSGDTTEGSGSYTVEQARTATKLPLTLRETPQSVTVVTREKMDDFHQNNLNQVLENTAGVTVERIESDRTYYTSRGSDITNFQVDGTGMPLTNGNVNGDVDTAIYDRIEVVRGATGLMTGAGNPSATVNMVRKRPTREFQASVKGEGGSWDHRRAEADISGSLVESEKVRGRMVLVKENGNSYLDRYSVDKGTVYGVMEADLTDTTLLTAGYSLQKNNADSPLWGALPLYYTDGSATNYDVSTSTSADWAYWNVDNERSFIELTQQLANGWQGKATYSHIKTTQDSRLFYVYGTPDPVTGLGLFSYPGLYQMEHRQDVGDINATGSFSLLGRTHEMVVGAMAAKGKIHELSLYSNDIGTPLPDLSGWNGDYPEPEFNLYPNGSDWTEQQAGAYLAARFSLSDDLSWIAGSRLSHWKSEGENYGQSKESSANGVVTPYTGLVYDLTRQLSAYASYTSIFAPQTKMDINRTPLDPIDGVSYETGIKGEHMDGRLNTALALFRTEQNNVAAAGGIIPGSLDTYYVAQDGIRTQGFELEATGEVLPDWQLAGSYTNLSIQDADGNQANTYTPRQLFKLSSSHRIGAWKLGGALRWQDDIYRINNLGGETRQGSYALLDLMARYEFSKQLYTALNINNVTDKKYINSLYWEQGYYGAPRSFNLTAGWKY